MATSHQVRPHSGDWLGGGRLEGSLASDSAAAKEPTRRGEQSAYERRRISQAKHQIVGATCLKTALPPSEQREISRPAP